MRKYFGTDGVRGVANLAPLDPETLVRIGRAIAGVFLKSPRKHRILIGKDTRLSGYMIETALASGITASGVDVMLTGPIPTPGVAYLTKSMRADAGIMISASHNSFEDNGIKIFGADGYKLADELEAEIEKMIDEPAINHRADATGIGKATRINDAIGRYTVALKSEFPRELSLEGMKIGLDCANGAGYIVAPQTFNELGAEVVSRGISPNGKNINAGFGSLYPEVIQRIVLDQNLHLGVSLDGDGDRAILVDEKGQIHDGDAVLAVMAIDLKRRGKLKNNMVVGTVMSNLGLEKLLEREGIKLVRSAVGDRYVLEEMTKSGSILGGEQSGHTIFGEKSTTGDGILTALMVLSVMCRSGKTLSELTKELVRFPQKLINLPVKSKPAIDSVPAIKNIIKEKESELMSNGRVLVRYSGTENKIRVMVECDDDTRCNKCASDIAEVISKEIGA
jgi:phosphoglucosamine mutase